MSTVALTPKIEAAIDDLAADFKKIVEGIERSTPTTQNHYGRYLELMIRMGCNDSVTRLIIAKALIRAGANRQGVRDAIRGGWGE